ncbi:hypothetical protein VTL71DRAFT_6228 [Oculimacula yallundae]|uniref:Uncharacterized protein n=1 Tax=Oculimacula yallundae TaxID=86028 RepID=A0ABR4C0X1_9HELO
MLVSELSTPRSNRNTGASSLPPNEASLAQETACNMQCNTIRIRNLNANVQISWHWIVLGEGFGGRPSTSESQSSALATAPGAREEMSLRTETFVQDGSTDSLNSVGKEYLKYLKM